ncbi:MAG: prephenate dehydrogenase/arogenate dehydrogenase family protein, partial [Nitrospirae bacterium]
AYDVVLLAAPLAAMPEVLAEVAARRPRGRVVEIASIKSHLRPALERLREAGTPAISLHPMFGPGKNPYEPLTVVHAVLGDEAEERELVTRLLAHPYLDLVSLPFERHDRLMGWLLGLAHLTGMLFADALARSGLHPAELARVASTTFKRQAATAASVLGEDPDLYFAIQRLNPHRGEVYAAITAAVGELTGAVERDDREAFREALGRAAGALPSA